MTAAQNDNKNIDMGDYEQLIRPASAFWRLRDGLTMAEKIMLYRNWKCQVTFFKVSQKPSQVLIKPRGIC